MLKFTPLEFETIQSMVAIKTTTVKIYSVGVWNAQKAQSAQEQLKVKIYSVGVWNDEDEIYIASGKMLKFTPLEFETYPARPYFLLL